MVSISSVVGNFSAHVYEHRIAELEAELLSARTAIMEFAARVKTDAPLNIPNRRGFDARTDADHTFLPMR
jgi:hypothetical protein